MVRAILEGRKSVTRRLADYSKWKKGDRVWVREAFAIQAFLGLPLKDPQPIHYLADVERGQIEDYTGKPSIHMPRWASRLTLELTADVRREPLQDINAVDLDREGFWNEADPVESLPDFAKAWDAMHPKQPWSENPIVSVIQFRRIDQ